MVVRWGVAFGDRAIPSSVIPRDRKIVIAGAAPMADQPRPRKQQDRNVGDEHEHHRDEDRGCCRQAQGTDDRTGEGEYDHEAGDLRERFRAEQVRAAANDAASQVTGVIERGVPVKENLAIAALDVHPRRSLGRIDLDPADLPTLGVAKLDQHAIRIAAGPRPFTKNLPPCQHRNMRA